jgi:dipeptidyl aminopeptidase/acylaminoacyl peptidase/tetratricopeptide (TPR) repeat protein
MLRPSPRAVLAGVLSALSLASLAAPAAAQEKRPLRVDDLFALREVGDPRLSPEGAQVAFTVKSLDAKKDKSDTDIYVVDRAGGDARRLTASPKAETSPRFSPDGKTLAFLSGREGAGKKKQVYLLPRSGGEAQKLTDYKGGVTSFSWSPDSKRLALIVSDPDPDESDEDKGKKTDDEEDASKTEKPIVLRRLQFKRDVDGFLKELREHLHVFDVEKKTGFAVTSGPHDHSDPVWSPDGQWIAFVSNRTPDPDANRNTDIFVVAPRPYSIPRPLTTAPTEASDPSWSPDGRFIAYAEGGDPADMYYGIYHLSIVPVAGGESRPLTKHLDKNPGSFTTRPRFSADGKLLYFLLEDRGSIHLARMPVAGGAVETLLGGERVVSAFELGPKGELVVLESQPDHPAEVSQQTPTGLKRLTRINDEALKGIKLGTVSRHVAKHPDGTEIDYFLTRPPDAPAGKLPAILNIHGGPVSQHQNEFDFEWQLYAANGYAVIAANPRGSSGRGRDFARAIWADWGGKDHEDVMAAVDGAIALGAADPDRLGVGGWSYGGILTDWTIYRTTHFKAATSGAGLANALAGYGTDHYQWEYEIELGFPWKNVEGWTKLSRPFLEADKIKTPTLLLCGEVDWNVPLIHSEQMYQALRRLGVPTELVVYPGESHSIKVPSYQKDRFERYLTWFGKYLKPAPEVTAPAVEATSFLGQPLASPAVPEDQRKTLEENLAKANAEYAKDPQNPENLIWVGRRLSSLSRFQEAVTAYSRGVVQFPEDVRFLRFRGHRYITLRQPDKAIADLSKADELIRAKGLKDAPEPDTPGPVPATATNALFFNVYYHLGLAHYLKGDFASAEKAYRECLRVSQASSSPDNVTATTRWLYATLRHLGKTDEAAKLVASFAAKGSGSGYEDLLLLYKGERTADQVLRNATSDLAHPTLGYGVADWHLVNGRKEDALALLREVVRGPQWAAFGYAAAEAELSRQR